MTNTTAERAETTSQEMIVFTFCGVEHVTAGAVTFVSAVVTVYRLHPNSKKQCRSYQHFLT